MRLRFACALAVTLTVASALDAQPPPKDRWRAFETDYFRFYSNAPRGRTRELVESFGRLHNLLTEGGRSGLEVTPVTVIIFKSQYSIDPYLATPQSYDIVRSWESLHTDERLWLLLNAAADDDIRPLAYRAYVSNYLYKQLPNLPYWAQEGLSSFYAGFRDKKGAEVAVGMPHPEYILTLRAASLLPWNELFAVTPDSELLTYPRGLARFKAQAWIAVHMLMTGGPRPEMAGKFFGPLDQGHSEEAILEQGFGWSLEDFNNHIRNYYNRGSIPYFPWDAGSLDPPQPRERSMSRPEVLHLLAEYLVTAHSSPPVDSVMAHLDPLLGDPEWKPRAEELLAVAGLTKVTGAKP